MGSDTAATPLRLLIASVLLFGSWLFKPLLVLALWVLIARHRQRRCIFGPASLRWTESGEIEISVRSTTRKEAPVKTDDLHSATGQIRAAIIVPRLRAVIAKAKLERKLTLIRAYAPAAERFEIASEAIDRLSIETRAARITLANDLIVRLSAGDSMEEAITWLEYVWNTKGRRSAALRSWIERHQ